MSMCRPLDFSHNVEIPATLARVRQGSRCPVIASTVASHSHEHAAALRGERGALKLKCQIDQSLDYPMDIWINPSVGCLLPIR